jgi:glycosyltransferase involved in cell wall biosynthesis
MRRDRIVFWLASPSSDLAPMCRAVADILPAGQTVCVFQEGEQTRRRALGCSSPNLSNLQTHFCPDAARIEALLGQDPRRSVHIFAGMIAHAPIRGIFHRAAAVPGPMVAVLSEARDGRGWRGALRRCHAVLHERRARDRLAFVLTMGSLGVNWFRACGYPEARLHSFGYVVEPPPAAALRRQGPAADEAGRSGRPVELVFVGQIIPRKGLDLLLHALAACRDRRWRLSLFGDGEARGALARLGHALGLHDRVLFQGATPNPEVRAALAAADLLVLPSRWDGWGAVVNEALMSGVPVVCSDACGARDLIRAGWNGDVFPCGSAAELGPTLARWIDRGPLVEARRAEIRQWSRCIAGPSMARYLLDVVAFAAGEAVARPAPPWTAGAPSTACTPAAAHASPLGRGSERRLNDLTRQAG